MHSVEGTAYRIKQLLGNPGLRDRLGRQAHEFVRGNFILPIYLKKWLLVLLSARFPGQHVVSLGTGRVCEWAGAANQRVEPKGQGSA